METSLVCLFGDGSLSSGQTVSAFNAPFNTSMHHDTQENSERKNLPCHSAKPEQSGECRIRLHPKKKRKNTYHVETAVIFLIMYLTKQLGISLSRQHQEGPDSWTYWRKGAQHLDPVLSSERMRRVHAAEVGEAGGRVCRSPAQDVAQLRRVGIDGVPRHQELGGRQTGEMKKERKFLLEIWPSVRYQV